MPEKKGNELSKEKTDIVEKESIFITDLDEYLFGQGTHYEIYKKLGAHLTEKDKKKGVYFAVWAPNAEEVSVIGSFNNWNSEVHKMKKREPMGVYELFIPDVKEGEMYKYQILSKKGNILYKADPFANMGELRPGNASVVANIGDFLWTDNEWMDRRKKTDNNKLPMAVYECHIGSWIRHPVDKGEGFYNYKEFADRIVDYLKEMNFTHIELMGIAEHPFDGSWGYQVTGYYAPTSRYGSPKDFMYLVNKLHKNNIGIILDWVPAHFPKDAHGLGEFDGSCLYEYSDPRKGEHPDWGTKIFDYGKNEVRNFLIANAIFWMKEFHLDGLRVDAVASMLYLDYGKQDGQWLPNKYGENKNLEAIEFFQHLNSVVLKMFPGSMMIAEESTAWEKVTAKVEDGGLGFSFKWNMGWMHDFLEYMKLDPYFRRDNHYKMTFAMSYNGSENYMLVLSHDEVVHLKCSMLNKMPGFYKDKFANLRVGYTYMFGHSGKKLLFMGQEFGQDHEWNEAKELDWGLLSDPDDYHSQLVRYFKALLNVYNKYPCMYELDEGFKGFQWINADDRDNSVYSFYRKASNGRNSLLFVLNFTPVARENYKLGVPKYKKYRLILNSDEARFGGSGIVNKKLYQALKKPCDDLHYSLNLFLPPLSALVFLF